ncbi:c-type cytochrome [Sphingomonas sabuli]|uniref:C-type cytochrome n=1 Tax=Sphingomonas sabuli TaxID=2764186 RepID=A0A7G9KZS2_9SPHN|nr:c-type cytochrome [Sphingomonas sabuli]
MRSLPALAAVSLLAACSADSDGPARFNASGELIAVSGGDAGAQFACLSCHGVKGEGDGDLVPRLAGLDAGYLVRQLDLYADGPRAHPQMAAIARKLRSEDRLAVSHYYAGLPAPVTAAPRGALYQRECAACHGAAGEGRPGVPAVAGQSAAYVERQFAAWASGDRRGDADGTMTRISRQWSSARLAAAAADVAALADANDYRGLPAACPPERRADPRNGASAPPQCVAGPAEPAR